MSKEPDDSNPGPIQQLLDDIQSAIAAPLSAIPEIAESDKVRMAAERLQQSQKDLYETLKDNYPSVVVNQVERERLRSQVVKARDVADEANESARLAREDLRGAVLAATSFGLSEHYIGRLSGIEPATIREWRAQDSEVAPNEDPGPESGLDSDSES
jgi:hypothetical protein